MGKVDPATPERELLRLIEGQHTKIGNRQKLRKLRHQGRSFFSLSAWIARISFFKTSLSGSISKIKNQPFDVKLLNKFLCFVIIFLAVYSFVFIFSAFKEIKGISSFLTLTPGATHSVKVPEAVSLKNSASYYINKARDRNIFEMKQVAKAASTQPAVKRSSSKIVEATKHLRLVGISWSKDPDAMIEDTKAMRTYFVKRGQKIGDIKVESILKDRVILSYEGETIELR